MNHHIAVVEPQMEELFHAPFNAALLHSIALAYPDAPISFRGFPGHIRTVRDILQLNAPELLPRIEWRTVPFNPGISLLSRWWRSRRAIREILAPGERVVFCSISRMQLLQLKRAMRPKDVVRAILHGDLHRIEQPPADKFPVSLFALQRVLLLPHPPGLRYILLSRSIWENVPPQFQQAMGNAGVIDHPYHFFPIGPAVSEPLVFGIFGNSGEAPILEAVARRVKAVNPNVRFRLVGFVDSSAIDRLSPFVEDVTAEPLPRQTFIERANSITHTLWISPPDEFRLRASGTFLDALAYAKPLVYLANPYIDPYYALEPGIGIRCESVDDMVEAILNLAEHHNRESYATARAAMERFRLRFTPQEQAKTLPEALQLN
jgi:hypothetical protein